MKRERDRDNCCERRVRYREKPMGKTSLRLDRRKQAMMIVVSNTYHPGVIIMSGLIRKSLVQVEFVVVMIMITVLMTIMCHNVEGNNDNDCHNVKDEKKK